MDQEITPILPEVPGIDLDEYKQILIERFSNPHIKDNVARICINGASQFPKFLVPTIVEQLKRGNNSHYCTLAVELKLSELVVKTEPGAKQILSVSIKFLGFYMKIND